MKVITQKIEFEVEGNILTKDTPDYNDAYIVKPAGFQQFRALQWYGKGTGKQYITASALKLTSTAGDVRYLVWRYASDIDFRGEWDGSVLNIYTMRNVENLGLFCEDKQTLLRTWTPRPNPGERPLERVFGTYCTSKKCVLIGGLPTLGVDPGIRPELPCVFGEPFDILDLPDLS